MRLSFKCVFLILVFTADINTANAGKWGIGLNYGTTESQGFDTRYRCFSCKTEDSSSATGIYLSYNYSDAYGLELGTLDLGQFLSNGSRVEERLFFDGEGNIIVFRRRIEVDVDADISANYIAATATYQFSDKLSGTARAGAASVKEKGIINYPDINEREIIDDSSTEAILGVSLDYNINKSLKAGIRFNAVDVFYTLGLNLQFNF